MWYVLFVLVLSHLQSAQGDANDGFVAYETLNYSWPSNYNVESMLRNKDFVPENLQFSSLAGNKFVTFSRLKEGVPFVLTAISNGNLRPWGFDENRQGHCNNLQNPLATDVDYDNDLMYVLDNGRTDIHTDNPNNRCPPKITAIYLGRSRDGGATVLSQNIDPSVVSSKSVLLSFVLDRPYNDGPYAKYAYIADGGTGRIIVHDFENQRGWSFQDPRMFEMVNRNVTFNNGTVSVRYGINALAMSPEFDYLYFTCTGSHNFYQIPLSALQDPSSDISSHIRTLSTNMGSFVNSMVSGKNAIYLSTQETNDVRYWRFKDDMAKQGLKYPEDTGKALMTKIQPFVRSGKQHWPYAMSLDKDAVFTWTSNRLELLYDGDLPKSSWNEFCCRYYESYEILWRTVDDESYHYNIDLSVIG